MRYFPQTDDSPRYKPSEDPDMRSGQHVGSNASYHFRGLRYEFLSSHGILRCPWYEVWLDGEVVYSSFTPPSVHLMDHLKLEACG